MSRSPATGCPIRISAADWVFAPDRGFSQLVTSFFASESQGILHVPFSPFLFLYLEKSPFSRVDPFFLGSLLRRSTSPRPCSGESLFSSVFCCFVLLVIYSLLLTLASLGLLSRSFRLISPETLALLLPSCQCPLFRVENNGFEPLTPCLQSRCSSQLS